jgi:2-polyprenyl-3-methyl-5-hydroxy-6-metoxy-1,4-benzoquinol methylase
VGGSAADLVAHGGNAQIRTRPCPACYLCGTAGTLLYENLNDRLFGAPGSWNFKQCPNSSCGLIWMDPMPVESDVGKAYENYYTHAPHPEGAEQSGIARAKAALTWVYESAWRFTPVYAERRELELMYLDGVPPGRVLEIGCGGGEGLAKLRARGWQVQGQDVDENAADHARKTHGVPVYCGLLDQAGFPDHEFDAVVMNHVIEHVHDPISLLKESKRVLKPGGYLVSVTPNTKGWGHARFGSNWIGIDRPRHLFLFSRNTLEQMARTCGFQEVETWTTAARSVWTVGGSLRIERGQTVRQPWALMTRAFRQAMLHAEALRARRKDPDAGDECVLKARG